MTDLALTFLTIICSSWKLFFVVQLGSMFYVLWAWDQKKDANMYEPRTRVRWAHMRRGETGTQRRILEM